jgi:hypothetical protein
VAFRLENQGTEPAKSVLITFSASPGLRLRPHSSENEDDKTPAPPPALPKAPEAPCGRYTNTLLGSWADDSAAFGAPAASRIPLPSALFADSSVYVRDPETFYYSGGRPQEFVEEISLTCGLFRHGLEPDYFVFAVQWDEGLRRSDGAIRCRVSAENMPQVEAYVLPVVVSHERGDISAEVERLRPRPSLLGRLWRRAGGNAPSE